MAGFCFRWQQILQLRQQKLRQAETHLADLAHRRRNCQQTMAQLERAVRGNACGPRGPAVPVQTSWDATYRHFELLQLQMAAQRTQLVQLDADWRQAKEEYEKRHREVEVLTKLQQRQAQAFAQQRERTELRQLDDLVLQQRSYRQATEARGS